MNSSQLDINPEIPEAFALYKHVQDNYGGDVTRITANSLSVGGGGGGEARGSIEARRNCSAIKEENMGYGDKSDYCDMKMSVIYFKNSPSGSSDGPWYTSCPKKEDGGCKKKVTETIGGGGWRCEKCDMEYPECTRRYILSTQCGDASGTNWFTFFNDEAEKLLGITADNLWELKNRSEAAYKDHFDQLLFKEFLATTRSKAEMVNDENRVKSVVYRYADIDFKDENRKMIDVLKKFEAM